MNRKAKTLLVLALVIVVGMAFRVSWNALRDIASAIGADSSAALLYPFVVDGLMALALVAALVLTDDDRRFALRVLAGYTAASLVLNYVHGMVPALHTHTAVRMHLAAWAPANWVLVLLATSLPVGSIFFGSDLVAKVLHHRPTPASDAASGSASAPTAERGEGAVQPASAPAPDSDPAPLPGPAPARPARVRTAPGKPRAPQTPGTGRTVRPVRTDAELLDALRDLRTGAVGPVSQRAALAALGIGVPRLRALLADHDLTLDPIPAPAPLHLVDTDHGDGAAAL
ncbi:Protein of unknown function [Streptomyces sp. DvalAA-14]|uniref:DUF2637 domain-containing protein n=1 Tax=unclassified Streptomyces TaxID=2593676 RepID=UPI00081B7CC4|nr:MULTISPECIES: DUF2637 domain-containing protein [unclassified Streptomyces]SCE48318.1 Protein of unknown function [Streptomyces sp. DvalAA-14]